MASSSPICKACLRATSILSPVPIAKRYSSRFVSATLRPLYLDFLAPAIPARDLLSGVPRSATRRPHLVISRSLATASTSASTEPPPEPKLARAILNPRSTPSGDPMQISLSPRAAHRLSAIATTENSPETALRITVESGGCHGFQYLMSLTDLSKNKATEDDTVFEGDKGARVVIDEASLELLNGSIVDYTMELIGSQFKVVGIPGATSSCGCGTSFDIKI